MPVSGVNLKSGWTKRQKDAGDFGMPVVRSGGWVGNLKDCHSPEEGSS